MGLAQKKSYEEKKLKIFVAFEGYYSPIKTNKSQMVSFFFFFAVFNPLDIDLSYVLSAVPILWHLISVYSC